MKISRADKHIFDAVMAHYGFDPDEVEVCKAAYRTDPQSARQTYAALFREIDPERHAGMAAGVNARILADFGKGLG